MLRRNARAWTFFALLTAALAAPHARSASPSELDRAQREVDQLERDTSLPEELRTRLLEAWKDTLQAMRDESRWTKAAADFEKLQREAPDRLKELRRELAQPAAAPEQPSEKLELTELEQALAQAQAAKTTAEQAVDDLQAERRARTDRRLALPGEINRVQQQIDALPAAAATATEEDEPPALAEARRARAAARAKSLQAELLGRQAELSSYDARSDLITLRQDLAVRRANEAGQRVDLLARRLDERRSAQAASASAQAEAARRQLASAPELVRELALENERLAAERQQLVDGTQRSSKLSASVQQDAERIEQRSRSMHRKIGAARFTKPVVALMRRHQAELPEVTRHRARLKEIAQDTSKQLAGQLDVEDERSELTDLGAAVAANLASLKPAPVGESARAEAEDTIRTLLERRRELLDALYQEQTAYLTQLAELDAAERRLIDAAESYGSFIDEHLLWLRDSPVIGPGDVVDSGRALAWLASPAAWGELLAAMGRQLAGAPLQLVLGLTALVLLVLRRVALRALTAIGVALGRSRRHRFAQTLQALGLTLAASLAWPLACRWLAELVTAAGAETRLGLPLAQGLERLAVLLLPLFVLRDSFRPQALAHAHFRWAAPLLETVRSRQWLLAFVAVPAWTLEAILDAQDRPELRDSLGRIALVTGLVAFALFLRRVLDPELKPAGQRSRLDRFLHGAAPAAALVLAVGALVGYLFAASELGLRLVQTCALLFGIALGHATALRWLVVERRRLRLEAMRKQAQAETGPELPADTATEGTPIAESEELDLDAVDSQTRQLLRAVVVVVTAMSVWALWADFLPATRAADRIVLWTVDAPEAAAAHAAAADAEATGDAEAGAPAGAVTLTDLLLAVALAVLAVFAAGNVPGLLEIAILRRLALAPGTGYAVTTLTRYAITIAGVVLTAGLLGLSWGKVQWLAAAMTVGLGFGLQEIFANFVSGLIILFEKPIRVGDVVTVGGVEGQVTKIRTRATTISDWDRRELLVPNREFITGQLINWTLTDPVTRVVVPVGIAYGSDTRLAAQKLLDVARANPLVLEEPKPSVVFRRFGESSLDFELRVFIPRRDVWPQLVHDLHLSIDDAFREADIEIAFPQRDIHVRTLPRELPAPAKPRD